MAKKQRHKYEYRPTPSTAAAKVVRMVGPGKRVLELGSGPGSITRLLRENDCRVVALEVDEKAIELVTQYCESVYSCDLNNSDWPAMLSELGKFEVVVAGDVLEHLHDPWTTLNHLKGLLADGGYIVISLPHVGHNAVIACLLTGDFSYQPWGLLDKTHIRFFAMKNMQRLFNEAGFKIAEVDFVVKMPQQTEFARYWRRLPAETRKVLSNNKFGTVYQVVTKAVPSTAIGRGLLLESLDIPAPSENSFSIGARGNRFLGFLLSFIGLENRKRIFRMLEYLGFRH